MNVGIFLTYGMSLKKWNEIGILDRELDIYKKLSKKINYTIFTYEKNDHDYLETNKIKIYDLSKYIIFKNRYLKFINSLCVPFFLKSKIEKLNILKSNQTLGSWVPAICSLLYKKKFIHRAGYDLYKNNLESGKKNIFFLFFFKIFINFLFKIADIILVTSSDHKKNLEKENKLKNKIIILPNFINFKKFNPIHKRKLKNKILFIGRIEEEKNLTMIINSLKNTKFSFDLIGKGKSEYMNKLLILAKRNKVKMNFIGSIRNNLLNKYYNQYKYFINFSNYEGNPKTVLEAMACGCIAVCSNVRGNKEIIKNNFNGILVKKNITSLKKNINNLYKINEKKIIFNALKTIKKKYSLETISKKEIRIYNLLLAK